MSNGWKITHIEIHSNNILSSTTFVRDNYVNFIPVARIVGHCAVAKTNVKLDYRIDKVFPY